jgi:hypothetical protein
VRPDIAFLLYAAERVIDGARLYVDVVEINPPLIIALNIPAVLLARLLGVSEILVYRLGFTVTLCGELALAWRCLGRALAGESERIRYPLLVLLAFILFPLSAQDFGQREHLMLALVLPWLLSAAGRMEGREPGRWEAGLLGALAGMGFALKPHFLPLWPAVEIVVHRATRSRYRLLTSENIAIATVLLVYGIVVLLATPAYLHLVVTLGPLYGSFLRDSFLHLLVTGPGASLIWLAILSWAALHGRAGHPRVWTAVAVGVAACFLGAALQQKGLRYHFYPAFALAVFLLGLVSGDVRMPLASVVQRIYRIVALSLVVTSMLVVAVENVGQALHRTPSPDEAGVWRLVEKVRAGARGESIFVFSYHIGSAFPLVNYAGVRSASRFPQLWILAAAYRDELAASSPLHFRGPRTMTAAERYLNQAVFEDLRDQKPAMLLVLRNARDVPENGYRRLDYLAYFGRDPRIAAILERYQRLEDEGEYALYRRLAPGEVRTAPAPGPELGTHDIVRADRGGLRLRFDDPAFVLRAGVFVLILLVVVLASRARRADALPT